MAALLSCHVRSLWVVSLQLLWLRRDLRLQEVQFPSASSPSLSGLSGTRSVFFLPCFPLHMFYKVCSLTGIMLESYTSETRHHSDHIRLTSINLPESYLFREELV